MDEQIGRYRLIKPLGEGAMASVYLAELETEIGFRRKVALKVVRSEFAKDKKFIALMGREAMIGSMLQHPNIVQTLEFNEADGRCFLALEYVEGQTLDQLLDSGEDGSRALPLSVALEAMVQVLKGLSYAHSLKSPEGEDLGIVHRDLKPGNIMLSRHGLVKVMDFGIAKARIASANITTAGQVRGTPIYMAPEQVTGKPLDGRADQFAAATVLYELLTGNQLFIANNLVRIMQRVARAEVDEQVEEIAALHPGVGPIAQRMWAKRADDRYETCEEPAQLLEDIVFELKAAERAMKSSGAGSPTGAITTPTPSGPARPAPETSFLSALGQFVRNIFTPEKPPPPPPKKKRRRKRKKRPQGESNAPTVTRVRAEQIGPPDSGGTPVAAAQPAPSASSEGVVFDDNVSDFSIDAVGPSASTPNIAPQPPDPREEAPTPVEPLAAQPEPEPAPPPQAAPPVPPAPGPRAAPPQAEPPQAAPAPADEPAPKTSTEDSLDPFFYADFDK